MTRFHLATRSGDVILKIERLTAQDMVEKEVARNEYMQHRQNEAVTCDERLRSGRDYLMTVESDEITVEGALEAFGFGRNGLGD